jgi:hypothetical protein
MESSTNPLASAINSAVLEEAKVLDINSKLNGKTHTKIVIPGPINNGMLSNSFKKEHLDEESKAI